MSLPFAAARALVERQLKQTSDDFALIDSAAQQYWFGWVFFYQSKKYLETKNPLDALAGNAPIIVNRFTSELETTGTAYRTEHYVAQYEERFMKEAKINLHSLASLTPRPQHGEKAFTPVPIAGHLSHLPGWQFVNGKIVKTFSFKNYYETIAFVNVLAAISHTTDHHPDLSVHYSRCVVEFNTHDVEHGKGGISINDFICAARIEVFLAQTAADM